jgi:hypothetical protein
VFGIKPDADVVSMVNITASQAKICQLQTATKFLDIAAHLSLESTTMKISDILFGTTDWSTVEKTEHKGETGVAYWRTRQFGSIRVRVIEYSPGYLADHWCSKGHILLCLEGELHTELQDGRKFTLTSGMSYQVADNAEPHRSFTSTGAKLFVVD